MCGKITNIVERIKWCDKLRFLWDQKLNYNFKTNLLVDVNIRKYIKYKQIFGLRFVIIFSIVDVLYIEEKR